MDLSSITSSEFARIERRMLDLLSTLSVSPGEVGVGDLVLHVAQFVHNHRN